MKRSIELAGWGNLAAAPGNGSVSPQSLRWARGQARQAAGKALTLFLCGAAPWVAILWLIRAL